MYLELITPDKKVFEGEVSSAALPGTLGSFEVLNNHAPIISSLAKGTVKLKTSEGLKTYQIDGGVVEVLQNKLVVLAEKVID
jgi:F-type H+-transporting ATPase subunit epsilon